MVGRDVSSRNSVTRAERLGVSSPASPDKGKGAIIELRGGRQC
jgi:hypothetical protein